MSELTITQVLTLIEFIAILSTMALSRFRKFSIAPPIVIIATLSAVTMGYLNGGNLNNYLIAAVACGCLAYPLLFIGTLLNELRPPKSRSDQKVFPSRMKYRTAPPNAKSFASIGQILQSRPNLIHVNFDSKAFSQGDSFRAEATEIRLSDKRITHIDLKQFSRFPMLRKLDLFANHPQSVDLDDLLSLKNLEVLVLGLNQIQEIELAPLESFRNLTELNLQANLLESLDLSPLSKCPNLEKLYIPANKLESIDLNPLSKCQKLKVLSLSNNPLKEIDLGPLSNCSGLEELDFNDTNMSDIDLRPLANCSKHSHLEFSNRWLLLPEVTPLAQLENLTERTLRLPYKTKADPLIALIYPKNPVVQKIAVWEETSKLAASIVSEEGWGSLLSRIVERQSSFVNKLVTLRTLGLSELFGFDGSLAEILESVPLELDWDSGVEYIREKLGMTLEQQMETGGPTIFIELNGVARTGLAHLVQKILERRSQEIQQTTIHLRPRDTDLTPLWITSYGFSILKAMGLGFQTSMRNVQRIRDELKKLGLRLNTSKEEAIEGVKMSYDMRKFILEMVGRKRKHTWYYSLVEGKRQDLL
ncbi:MAG: leucine-rich repeat domain-containing protein [Candidatus Thorarchaeota archaeon]|nr:leucine-rich repeat domain-containing protein [Candidatus Thorarchaeota archaeon]